MDGQHHLRDDQAQQALAVHVGCGRSVPNCRQVLGQEPHGLLVGLTERQQFGPAHDRILLLQLFQRLQRRVPAALQGAGDQTVLRLDRVVLALGARCLVAGALDPQLPVPVQGLALALEFGQRRQRGLDRCRPDRLQEQRTHGAVQVYDRKGLAHLGGIVDLRPAALAAQVVAAVADAHPPPAAAAHHEALQQRPALARRPAPLAAKL